MTHTPTPLKTGYLGRQIVDSKGRLFAKAYDRKTAAHIVKCVNMHDELVEVLRNLYSGCSEDDATKCFSDAYRTLKKAEALY